IVKLQRRGLGEPDSVREVPFGRIETYDLGELRFGRSVMQPGWRWSTSIKPIAGTEVCEDHHVGYSISGACRVLMREGAELLVTINWQPSTTRARSEGGDYDRVLGTLLVTDIVNSTARALELGDGAWRDLLARHNLAVRTQLDRFRGREVTTTGDGFIATFDGAERAIRAAQEICRAASELGIQVRAGVHTG